MSVKLTRKQARDGYRLVAASSHVYEVLNRDAEVIGEVWRIGRFRWSAKRRFALSIDPPLAGSHEAGGGGACR